MASRVRPQAMTKLIYHYRYNAGRLQILTCATRQTSKQITSRNDRSSSIDLAMHDIIQKSNRLFNKLENEKIKYMKILNIAMTKIKVLQIRKYQIYSYLFYRNIGVFTVTKRAFHLTSPLDLCMALTGKWLGDASASMYESSTV